MIPCRDDKPILGTCGRQAPAGCHDPRQFVNVEKSVVVAVIQCVKYSSVVVVVSVSRVDPDNKISPSYNRNNARTIDIKMASVPKEGMAILPLPMFCQAQVHDLSGWCT